MDRSMSIRPVLFSPLLLRPIKATQFYLSPMDSSLNGYQGERRYPLAINDTCLSNFSSRPTLSSRTNDKPFIEHKSYHWVFLFDPDRKSPDKQLTGRSRLSSARSFAWLFDPLSFSSSSRQRAIDDRSANMKFTCEIWSDASDLNTSIHRSHLSVVSQIEACLRSFSPLIKVRRARLPHCDARVTKGWQQLVFDISHFHMTYIGAEKCEANQSCSSRRQVYYNSHWPNQGKNPLSIDIGMFMVLHLSRIWKNSGMKLCWLVSEGLNTLCRGKIRRRYISIDVYVNRKKCKKCVSV